MRNRSRRRQMSEINVVPYIDVMLVLLIIFMITAPLLSQGVDVQLPQVPSKPMPADDREPVIISVDKDGNFFSSYPTDSSNEPKDAQTVVNLIAAARRIQQENQGRVLPVYVKGDRAVNYGRVVELMALLQRAGVEGVGLITDPEQ